MSQPFRADVESIRSRARANMERGSITEAYGLHPEHVVNVLNAILATEIVCILRYKSSYFTAKSVHAESAAEVFFEHAHEEQEHVDAVSERIIQLGGKPNLDPKGLAARSYAQYIDSDDVLTLLRENLVAERIAIQTYTEFIRWLDNNDPSTRRMMEIILRAEEEHAHELITLLGATVASSGPTPAASGVRQR